MPPARQARRGDRGGAPPAQVAAARAAARPPADGHVRARATARRNGSSYRFFRSLAPRRARSLLAAASVGGERAPRPALAQPPTSPRRATPHAAARAATDAVVARRLLVIRLVPGFDDGVLEALLASSGCDGAGRHKDDLPSQLRGTVVRSRTRDVMARGVRIVSRCHDAGHQEYLEILRRGASRLPPFVTQSNLPCALSLSNSSTMRALVMQARETASHARCGVAGSLDPARNGAPSGWEGTANDTTRCASCAGVDGRSRMKNPTRCSPRKVCASLSPNRPPRPLALWRRRRWKLYGTGSAPSLKQTMVGTLLAASARGIVIVATAQCAAS